MSKKRILHKIKLTEISAVDKPCQEGATMTIMKRAPQVDARVAELRKRVAAAKTQLEHLQKYDPDQPRDEEGRWSESAKAGLKTGLKTAAAGALGAAAAIGLYRLGGTRIATAGRAAAAEAMRGVKSALGGSKPKRVLRTSPADRLAELQAQRKRVNEGRLNLTLRERRSLNDAIKALEDQVKTEARAMAAKPTIKKGIQGKSVEEVIKDFVHSTNPRFKGKSKKQRIKMALGAWYGMNKYSPDQKRDDRGRWTDGGGSGGSLAAPAPEAEGGGVTDYLPSRENIIPLVSAAAGWLSLPVVNKVIQATPLGKYTTAAFVLTSAAMFAIEKGTEFSVNAAVDQFLGKAPEPEKARDDATDLIQRLIALRKEQLQKAADKKDPILERLEALLAALKRAKVEKRYRPFLQADAMLSKYSPDQKRDEKGRWTEGGVVYTDKPNPLTAGKSDGFGTWSEDGSSFTPDRDSETYQRDYRKTRWAISNTSTAQEWWPKLAAALSGGYIGYKGTVKAHQFAFGHAYRMAQRTGNPVLTAAVINAAGLIGLIAPLVGSWKAARWASGQIQTHFVEPRAKRFRPERREKAQEIADILAQARSMAAHEKQAKRGRKMEKFDPDQPRDEQGRWSETGRGGSVPHVKEKLAAKATPEQESMVRGIIDKMKEKWQAFVDLPEHRPILGNLAHLLVASLPGLALYAHGAVSRYRYIRRSKAYQQARQKQDWTEYDRRYGSASGSGSSGTGRRGGVQTHETAAEKEVRLKHGVRAAKVLALYLKSGTAGEKEAARLALKKMGVDVTKLAKAARSSPWDLLNHLITEQEAKELIDNFLSTLSAEDARKIIAQQDSLIGNVTRKAA